MDVGGQEILTTLRLPLAQKDASDLELGKNLSGADLGRRQTGELMSPTLLPPTSPLQKPAAFSLPAPATSLPEVNRGYNRSLGGRADGAMPAVGAGGASSSTSTSLSRRGIRGPSANRHGYNTDARSSYQRSRYADNVVAMCMAGSLNLKRLLEDGLVGRGAGVGAPGVDDAKSSPAMSTRAGVRGSGGRPVSAERRSVESASNVVVTPALTTGTNSGAGPFGALGAEKVDQFGTGDNLVVQLRLYGDKDLFAFQFGCLVFWSFQLDQIEAAKECFKKYLERPLADADIEQEKMEFIMEPEDVDGGGAGAEGGDAEDQKGVDAVRQDQIVLKTTSPYERLAHSYALAQSVRLGVYENAVDRSIADTRSIPETMAETGEVNLDLSQLSRRMGGLLMLRCDVNLHTDILDTPEIFWDEDRFEPHYMSCRGNLDVDKRVEILNQRLGVLKDLYDLLQNGLNVRHGNKLEIIIIILILVEVLLELVELLYDSWTHK